MFLNFTIDYGKYIPGKGHWIEFYVNTAIMIIVVFKVNASITYMAPVADQSGGPNFFQQVAFSHIKHI